MGEHHPSPSEFDVQALAMLRRNVEHFLTEAGARLRGRSGLRVLDVAPQDHGGARAVFPKEVTVETLDIDPDSGATHVGDLCDPRIADDIGCFDMILCTEVLGHTRQPFDACKTLYRMLKPGARVFVTTPFNFRIHGPLPDCWRFTEHGLRELFADFEIEALTALETPERFLMPIQYTLVARRPE